MEKEKKVKDKDKGENDESLNVEDKSKRCCTTHYVDEI